MERRNVSDANRTPSGRGRINGANREHLEPTDPGRDDRAATPGRATAITSSVTNSEGATTSRAVENADSSTLLTRFRGHVERQIGRDAFARYFDGQIDMRLRDGRLSIAAPTRFLASMIERRFGDALRGAASSFPGMDGLAIEVAADEPAGRTETRKRSTSDSPVVVPGRDARPASSNRRADRAGSNESRLLLNDRYRLEEFIVGDSNRLAYDAAARLAESEPMNMGDERAPARSPGAPLRARPIRTVGLLFIHGPCGMGKTHLLQGVAHRFSQRHPGAIVRFITGEAFTNEFIAALHGNRGVGKSGSNHAEPRADGRTASESMERFRNRYRRVDLLCIDDVHFLASKAATQAELLHTFNELEMTGAQIVIACDEHPKHVKKFSDALVSRFMSGMVARVDLPDRALCEKLLRRFAEKRGLVFDQAALRSLSAHVAAVPDRSGSAKASSDPAQRGFTIREMEGLITRIEAYLRLSADARPDAPLPVTIGVLRQILDGRISTTDLASPRSATLRSAGSLALTNGSPDAGSVPSAPLNGAAIHTTIGGGRPIRLESIISETCRLLGVEHTDLVGNGRHPRVVLARSIIGHLARRLTRLSFPEIARGMGRPSHSTIIAACQRLERQLAAADGVAPLVVGLDLTVAELCDRIAHALTPKAQ